jgi:AbiTii
MSEANSLILKIQDDAAESSKPVADMLRLAKVAATKLDAREALTWIDRELDGYPSVLAKDLPMYRQLYGKPMALNPVRGWQPIMFMNSEIERTCSYAPVGQSLPSLEAILRKSNTSGHFEFDYPAELAAQVRKAMQWNTQVHIQLGYGQMTDIVDQVRNLILSWTLALENAGVTGEGMTFTAQEKIEAAPITNQYIIQNVGVLGSVSDFAKVTNTQSSAVALDLQKAKDFVGFVRGSAAGLPAEIRGRVLAEAAKADAQLNSREPNQTFLRTALETIGSVCEQAAGNVVAIGIVAGLKALSGM